MALRARRGVQIDHCWPFCLISTSGCAMVQLTRRRPNLSQCRTNLNRVRPNLAQVGPHLGRDRPTLDQSWSSSARVGSMLGPLRPELAEIDQSRALAGHVWPDFGPNFTTFDNSVSTKLGPSSAHFGRARPNLGPISTDLGQEFDQVRSACDRNLGVPGAEGSLERKDCTTWRIISANVETCSSQLAKCRNKIGQHRPSFAGICPNLGARRNLSTIAR